MSPARIITEQEQVIEELLECLETIKTYLDSDKLDVDPTIINQINYTLDKAKEK